MGCLLNTNTPKSAERLQIIVKNETSGDSASQTQILTLYGNVITAAGAIGGGVVASLLTHRHNREIEEKKNEGIRKLEEQKRLAQKHEEEEFNTRIRRIVNSELVFISRLLDELLTNDEQHLKGESALYRTIKNYPREYITMSLERRAQVFNANSLFLIERAYGLFGWFADAFEIEFRHFLGDDITLEDLRSNLGISDLKERIDDAIKSITEQDTVGDRTK